jgi:hypothetical protein
MRSLPIPDHNNPHLLPQEATKHRTHIQTADLLLQINMAEVEATMDHSRMTGIAVVVPDMVKNHLVTSHTATGNSQPKNKKQRTFKLRSKRSDFSNNKTLLPLVTLSA